MLGATPLMPKSAGVAAEQATVQVAEVTTHETLPFLDRVFTALTLKSMDSEGFLTRVRVTGRLHLGLPQLSPP